MAISARLIRSLLPALVSAGLVLAACSSDSDSPAPDQIDDPKPGDGGSDSSGGGTAGAPEPGDAGSPPVSGGTGTGVGGETEPGTGGTPDPGTAGAGGGEDGPPGPTETFLHGQEIYTEKCVVCHQADLGGSGFYPNISADTLNGIGSWSDEEIGDAITKGLDPEGEKLCSFMIPVTDMSAGDLADLIEYLRGAPASDRKITVACPAP